VPTLPISVVIPAYQAESHIMRALEGVAEQTAQPGEVLVIDDGSKDRTAAVARRAGARVIEQPNGGASSARNAGIRAARFPWVALLDADDRWFPEKLQLQWDAHEKQPDARILLTDYSVLGLDGSDLGSAFTRLPHYADAPRRALGGGVSYFRREDFASLVARANVVSSSTLLLERAWLIANDLFYAPHLPAGDDFAIAEDYEWLLRALRYSDVLVVERCLADYLQRPDSKSAQRGRQAYGDVALGEFIAGQPAAYAMGASASFQQNRPFHQRRAALEYVRQGEFGAAAATLVRALREKPNASSAALLALASVGRWAPAGAAIQRARELRLRYKRRRPSLPPAASAPPASVRTAPISVVIPAHNVAAYLGGAIESVRAQTLQPAEIIVVDDGSIDVTREVAELAGVRVIAQPQSGVSNARNAGVAAASSPWIALLDADDRWLPDKLERQWQAHLLAPEARFLASDIKLVFETGGEIESAQAVHPSYGATEKREIAPGIVRLDSDSLARTLPRAQSLTPSTWLVERALLLAEPFDSSLPTTPLFQVGEDFEWLLRALRQSEAVVVEEPLTAYLVRASGNLSANEGRQRFGDVKLGAIVAAAPERYLAGAAATFRSLRAEQERIATLAFLRAGDARGAEAVLASVPARARNVRWLALRVLTFGLATPLGTTALRGARTLRRSLARR
jgi:glycosyltransferase involved in cell wall biosynthesis